MGLAAKGTAVSQLNSQVELIRTIKFVKCCLAVIDIYYLHMPIGFAIKGKSEHSDLTEL